MRILTICYLLLSAVAAGASTEPLEYEEQTIDFTGDAVKIRVPAGYVLELLSDRPDSPRLITFASNGDLFMGSRSGQVYRVPPPYTHPEVVISLDDYPHSVDFRQGEILIAQTDGVYHAPYRPGQKRIAEDDLSLLAGLPAGGGHNSRTVRVGPDGRIYVSLGISGNCSDHYLGEPYSFEDRRGGVLVLDEQSGKSGWQTFASGLRNPVGFDWHPQTGVMYSSNNGPDHLGYENPPEYFSRLEAGSFHGMPWFQLDGKTIRRDPCISRQPPRPVADVTLPVVTFPARNAPMAVAFVPQGKFIDALANDALVALKGSWGTRPSGGFIGDPATRRHPKIVVVRFDNGKAIGVDDLITGFQLKDGSRWARPVGVAIGPDGALYFTSDSGIDGLYRLRRKPQ